MNTKRWLVTGALGCLGAWVTKLILERGDEPILLDLSADRRRLADLVGDDVACAQRLLHVDLTESPAVDRAVADIAPHYVVHLAGLQVPFCKADPVLGARVNVVGTLNVFESALRHGVERVAYASSAAVYGPSASGPNQSPPDESVPCQPRTHYGAFKLTNERNAAVYFQDRGLSSVGLRPLTVYGVGRDQGMTSDPTRAVKAALVGRPFRIRFTGETDFLYAEDCARAFLAGAESGPIGAHVFNVHGERASVRAVLDVLGDHGIDPLPITIEGDPIPFPAELDGRALGRAYPSLTTTPFKEGVAATLRGFQRLKSEGRLRLEDLDG